MRAKTSNAVRLITAVCCLLIMGACGTKQNDEKKQTKAETGMTGNDRDAHGCIPSAGYSWSEVRQACIRVFEDGIRLNDTTDPGATSSAFALFSTSKDSVEVFLPKQQNSIILTRQQECWKDKEYSLCDTDGKIKLFKDEKEIYAN